MNRRASRRRLFCRSGPVGRWGRDKFQFWHRCQLCQRAIAETYPDRIRPIRIPGEQMTTPLRVAVVDDEELARSVVREFLTGVDEVEIVAECANDFEAVKAVADLKPDLLLLDVQMPKLNGFEVLELVGRDQPVV